MSMTEDPSVRLREVKSSLDPPLRKGEVDGAGGVRRSFVSRDDAEGRSLVELQMRAYWDTPKVVARGDSVEMDLGVAETYASPSRLDGDLERLRTGASSSDPRDMRILQNPLPGAASSLD